MYDPRSSASRVPWISPITFVPRTPQMGNPDNLWAAPLPFSRTPPSALSYFNVLRTSLLVLPFIPPCTGSSIHLFIYLAALGLSCGTWELCYVIWDLSLQYMDSLVAACGLSSCSVLVLGSVAHGILVPRPEIESASPALQGRFLTTGPPGTLQLHKFLRDRD